VGCEKIRTIQKDDTGDRYDERFYVPDFWTGG
jgi:hypothetical protein